jgi:hypothetical protein
VTRSTLSVNALDAPFDHGPALPAPAARADTSIRASASATVTPSWFDPVAVNATMPPPDAASR